MSVAKDVLGGHPGLINTGSSGGRHVAPLRDQLARRGPHAACQAAVSSMIGDCHSGKASQPRLVLLLWSPVSRKETQMGLLTALICLYYKYII